MTWLLMEKIANKTSSQAQMEAMFALDFVSLILSKHAPRQAETSISAFLKQAVPLGSLNSEVVNPPPKPESAIQDAKAVSRGWRLQSFDAAANKLLKSASRLEAEVASETRYWSEVLAVKDKGWKMCRLPRERQSLGVQYGFLEGKILRQVNDCRFADLYSYANLPGPRPRISTTSRGWKFDTGQGISAIKSTEDACAGENK